MTLKTQLRMTASERIMGRFMRGPDGHDDGGTGGEATPASEDKAAGQSEASEELSTEDALEKEFGVTDDSPAADDEDADEGDDSEDTDDLDGDEEEEGADGDEGGDPDPAEKPKTRSQERIDALVRDKREAEADAAFWKRRAEELGANSPDAGEEVAALVEPDPTKYEFGDADLDYIKDKAKFDAKIEVLGEQAEARLKSEAAQLEVKWTANVEKATETYPDFDEVVVVGAKEGKWHCPPVIALGIKDSDEGIHVAYKLAKDPALSEKLAKLTPLEQAREFGRMERDIFHGRNAPKSETPKPNAQQSKAPKPPKRRINGSGGAANVAADTDDFAAFERMADAKMAKKANRG